MFALIIGLLKSVFVLLIAVVILLLVTKLVILSTMFVTAIIGFEDLNKKVYYLNEDFNRRFNKAVNSVF